MRHGRGQGLTGVAADAAPRVLCALDDIEDGGALGFDDVGGDHHPGIFVVREGSRVFGYVNDCPHWNITLDYVPGRFMNRDKQMIQCANHGARFRIEDGLCVFGPCHGERLTPVAVSVENGRVVLDALAEAPQKGGMMR